MPDLHPLAPHHLPRFLPGPDGSDPLFTAVVVIVLVILMLVGVTYFRLHSLPEQLAEKRSNTQILLISVLAVLALLTHNNTFWILALLLAVIRIPDFLTPLQTIADSLKKVAIDSGKANSNETSSVETSDIAAQQAVTRTVDEPDLPPGKV